MTISIPDLVSVRARHPEAIAEAAARRVRRPLVGDSGRLMIVAADHPARGALGVGDRRFAMADRADLLERLCVALSRPGVDGVLATADILEDLLLLGVLENKVVMGSMNRGAWRAPPSRWTTASPATAPRTSPASASTRASCCSASTTTTPAR